MIIGLLGIKTRLVLLHKSMTKKPIKDAIKAIIEKLNELVALPSKVDPKAEKGIVNKGNDCFLIALCQLLRSKSLTKHLVNRLPKELWEPLVADNSNAKYIRKAIVDHTPFGATMSAIGADPMTSQLDAGEALMALFNRIDEADSLPVPPIANPLRTAYNTNYAQATNFLTKANLFTIFWMTTISETIQNAVVSLLLDIFTSDDGVQTNYMPHITAPRPQNRPIRNFLTPSQSPPNPLHLHIKYKLTYTPDPGTPVKYRNHKDFGGSTHKSERHEQKPYLPLPMEKTPQGVYTFNHILEKAFSLGDNDEDVEATILNKKGKKRIKRFMLLYIKKYT